MSILCSALQCTMLEKSFKITVLRDQKASFNKTILGQCTQIDDYKIFDKFNETVVFLSVPRQRLLSH